MKISILCVDDQPSNLISLDAALSHQGYHIVQAKSGPEALVLLNQEDFAVILLDVQMPEMDGFETARRIRKHPHAGSTPIIFLTANYPTEEQARLGYAAGAVDYLFKPLNLDILRSKVAIFADLYKKTVEIQQKEELLRQADRRDSERALAEVKRVTERRFEKLVEGIRDGVVWAVNPKTRMFTYLSSRVEKITGYSAEQWLSHPSFWLKHLPPEDLSLVRQGIEHALERPDGGAIDHRFIRADGSTLWLHTELHMDIGGEGHEPEVRGLSVDVTHLKEIEEALRQAIQIRDEFLSIASHELRTPITPLQMQMQGFIRMIDTGRLNQVSQDKLKEMLEISDAQVTRLARLIGQLLDVSRITTGKLGLEKEKVNLANLVRGVLEQLDHELQSSHCPLKIVLDEQIEGYWDPLRVEQVVINLLNNAMKYASDHPIEVELTQDDGRALLSVRDHGIGIAPEDQSRIFDRYERAVSPRHFGGLGLGLYISKQIVEMHQGNIRVESRPNEGATFLVELPL